MACLPLIFTLICFIAIKDIYALDAHGNVELQDAKQCWMQTNITVVHRNGSEIQNKYFAVRYEPVPPKFKHEIKKATRVGNNYVEWTMTRIKHLKKGKKEKKVQHWLCELKMNKVAPSEHHMVISNPLKISRISNNQDSFQNPFSYNLDLESDALSNKKKYLTKPISPKQRFWQKFESLFSNPNANLDALPKNRILPEIISTQASGSELKSKTVDTSAPKKCLWQAIKRMFVKSEANLFALLSKLISLNKTQTADLDIPAKKIIIVLKNCLWKKYKSLFVDSNQNTLNTSKQSLWKTIDNKFADSEVALTALLETAANEIKMNVSLFDKGMKFSPYNKSISNNTETPIVLNKSPWNIFKSMFSKSDADSNALPMTKIYNAEAKTADLDVPAKKRIMDVKKKSFRSDKELPHTVNTSPSKEKLWQTLKDVFVNLEANLFVLLKKLSVNKTQTANLDVSAKKRRFRSRTELSHTALKKRLRKNAKSLFVDSDFDSNKNTLNKQKQSSWQIIYNKSADSEADLTALLKTAANKIKMNVNLFDTEMKFLAYKNSKSKNTETPIVVNINPWKIIKSMASKSDADSNALPMTKMSNAETKVADLDFLSKKRIFAETKTAKKRGYWDEMKSLFGSGSDSNKKTENTLEPSTGEKHDNMIADSETDLAALSQKATNNIKRKSSFFKPEVTFPPFINLTLTIPVKSTVVNKNLWEILKSISSNSEYYSDSNSNLRIMNAETKTADLDILPKTRILDETETASSNSTVLSETVDTLAKPIGTKQSSWEIFKSEFPKSNAKENTELTFDASGKLIESTENFWKILKIVYFNSVAEADALLKKLTTANKDITPKRRIIEATEASPVMQNKELKSETVDTPAKPINSKERLWTIVKTTFLKSDLNVEKDTNLTFDASGEPTKSKENLWKIFKVVFFNSHADSDVSLEKIAKEIETTEKTLNAQSST